MHVRSPGAPDDHEPTGRPSGPSPGTRPVEVAYRVPTGVIVAKFAVAGLIAVLAGFGQNSSQRTIGLLAAAVATAYAVRDLLVRERLRADADGVTAVRGYAGRRCLAWSEIESVRVDSRPRLGARTDLLEIDAGDEIFLYARTELGVDPHDAVEALNAVRASGTG